jgi:catechol 2,3-dioxygenase-like lactoylglutathione lyase family enzyme
MRGVMLFAAGLIVGAAVQVPLAQTGGVVMMNHVAIAVPNVNEAVAHYAQKMGYREAFRGPVDAQGQPALVYMHISRNTFLEIQPVNPQRSAGFNHYGLHVDDINTAVAMYRQRGVMVTDPNKSGNTNALLANITDPYMGRIELAELTPDSSHRKAIDTFK